MKILSPLLKGINPQKKSSAKVVDLVFDNKMKEAAKAAKVVVEKVADEAIETARKALEEVANANEVIEKAAKILNDPKFVAIEAARREKEAAEDEAADALHKTTWNIPKEHDKEIAGAYNRVKIAKADLEKLESVDGPDLEKIKKAKADLEKLEKDKLLEDQKAVQKAIEKVHGFDLRVEKAEQTKVKAEAAKDKFERLVKDNMPEEEGVAQEVKEAEIAAQNIGELIKKAELAVRAVKEVAEEQRADLKKIQKAEVKKEAEEVSVGAPPPPPSSVSAPPPPPPPVAKSSHKAQPEVKDGGSFRKTETIVAPDISSSLKNSALFKMRAEEEERRREEERLEEKEQQRQVGLQESVEVEEPQAVAYTKMTKIIENAKLSTKMAEGLMSDAKKSYDQFLNSLAEFSNQPESKEDDFSNQLDDVGIADAPPPPAPPVPPPLPSSLSSKRGSAELKNKKLSSAKASSVKKAPGSDENMLGKIKRLAEERELRQKGMGDQSIDDAVAIRREEKLKDAEKSGQTLAGRLANAVERNKADKFVAEKDAQDEEQEKAQEIKASEQQKPIVSTDIKQKGSRGSSSGPDLVHGA